MIPSYTYTLPSPLLTNDTDANEPSFLRKLKSQYGGADLARHERPIARPKRLKDDDEDNEPTYVDETTRHTISKADFEAMQSNDNESLDANKVGKLPKASGGQEVPTGESGPEAPVQKQQLAAIGGPIKRKVVKVVGQEDENLEAEPTGKVRTKMRNVAKKAKKVKLSFDEEG